MSFFSHTNAFRIFTGTTVFGGIFGTTLGAIIDYKEIIKNSFYSNKESNKLSFGTKTREDENSETQLERRISSGIVTVREENGESKYSLETTKEGDCLLNNCSSDTNWADEIKSEESQGPQLWLRRKKENSSGINNSLSKNDWVNQVAQELFIREMKDQLNKELIQQKLSCKEVVKGDEGWNNQFDQWYCWLGK